MSFLCPTDFGPSLARRHCFLWEPFQTVSFAEFKALYSGLNIPVTGGSDPLLALWKIQFSILHPDMRFLPICTLFSMKQFAALVKSKQVNSSGGPICLQYKHLQSRQPQMIAEAYECLATIWQGLHIPAAWKWKWHVPIPKPYLEHLLYYVHGRPSETLDKASC